MVDILRSVVKLVMYVHNAEPLIQIMIPLFIMVSFLFIHGLLISSSLALPQGALAVVVTVVLVVD
jgi:hypothetical protein